MPRARASDDQSTDSLNGGQAWRTGADGSAQDATATQYQTRGTFGTFGTFGTPVGTFGASARTFRYFVSLTDGNASFTLGHERVEHRLHARTGSNFSIFVMAKNGDDQRFCIEDTKFFEGVRGGPPPEVLAFLANASSFRRISAGSYFSAGAAKRRRAADQRDGL